MSTGTASSRQRSIDRRMGLLEADALDGRAFHGQRTTDAAPDLGASGPVPPHLLSRLPPMRKAAWAIGAILGWLVFGAIGGVIALLYLSGPRRRLNARRL
jgi:hypothetical protein